MQNKINTVTYKKKSSHGIGPIPIGTEGKVLLYVENRATVKLLIDFGEYGKAIVPLSYVNVIN